MRGQPALTSPSGREKVNWSNVWQVERLAGCLFAFTAIWSPEWGGSVVWVAAQPWKPALGQQYGTFWLENRLEHSQCLLNWSCVDSFAGFVYIQQLRWQPPRWWSYSSFWLFFSSFSALKREFVWLYDNFLFPQAYSTNDFYSHWIFAALANAATKLRTSFRAWTVGGSGF